MIAVSQTPIAAAPTATRIDREPSSTHDTSAAGAAKSRIRNATGASSPRPPSRRITHESVPVGLARTDLPDVPRRRPTKVPMRSTVGAPPPAGRAATRGHGRPSGPVALVYSPGSSTPAETHQEVGRCSRKARRSSREADPSLRQAPAPERRRNTGDMYPSPRAPAPGLFVCPGGGVARSPLMPATVIVGLQWGDEGKGKTTDFLAEQVAMVVRYQGGDNAGHTVVSGEEVFKLRLTPSGVLYPHITSVIGNGVVVNPVTLIGELDMLAARGIDTSRVRVSSSAHVIMPYHVALDVGNEARLDGARVGTTGRGIGPTYGDRAWRLGLRMEDLLDRDILRERISRALPDKNLLLANMEAETFEVEPLVDEAAGW